MKKKRCSNCKYFESCKLITDEPCDEWEQFEPVEEIGKEPSCR